jgi:hypothetical protein
MTYPQPNANSYAVNGGQFFRLNTLLASPGDIYESEQSGHAFAIGANSDMSRVNVAYFDRQAPNFMNMLTLGPERSFVGRVDADNLSAYSPSNRPGRILFWPDELWNPNVLDPFVGPGDTKITVTPRLDVVEYFKPQGSLEVKRNDKRWLFQRLTVPATESAPGVPDSVWIAIPYYGRKYANIDLSVPVAPTVNFDIIGVKLQIDAGQTFNKSLSASLGISSAQVTIQAGLQGAFPTPRGMWDVLLFKLTTAISGTGNLANLSIITSDTPAE